MGVLGPQGHSQPGPGTVLEQLPTPWDEGLTPACRLSGGREEWARRSVGAWGMCLPFPLEEGAERTRVPAAQHVGLVLQVSGLSSRPLPQPVHAFSVWE